MVVWMLVRRLVSVPEVDTVALAYDPRTTPVTTSLRRVHTGVRTGFPEAPTRVVVVEGVRRGTQWTRVEPPDPSHPLCPFHLG